MSDADPEAVDAENPEGEADDPPEQDTEDAEDEQPQISDEEMADFGAVASKIEDEADESSEDSSETETELPSETEQGDADSDSDESTEDSSESDLGEVGIGDLYCNSLGMAAAVSRKRYGSADEQDRDELAEEYADMARQIDLDRYLDQWIEESRHLDSLGPGQAVLLGSLMFGGMVAMDDPELVETASGKVRDHA